MCHSTLSSFNTFITNDTTPSATLTNTNAPNHHSALVFTQLEAVGTQARVEVGQPGVTIYKDYITLCKHREVEQATKHWLITPLSDQSARNFDNANLCRTLDLYANGADR